MIASGMSLSLAYGVTGIWQSDESENKYASFSWIPYGQRTHFTITGSVRSVANLILQQAMAKKESYTFIRDSHVYEPRIVLVGPFVFDVKDMFHPQIPLQTEMDEQEMALTKQIVESIGTLQTLRAFL